MPGTSRPYEELSTTALVSGDKVMVDSAARGTQQIDFDDLSTQFQLKSQRGAVGGYAELDSSGKVPATQLRSAYTIETVANAAARNALTVTTPQIAVRQVRLADTGVIYVPNAAGSGAGIWEVFNSVGVASSSAEGVVMLADSADASTDDAKALTIAEFLRRLGPYRNSLAPAQALSFDGTAGATIANTQVFGTGDFSVAATVSPTAIGAVQAIVGGAVNAFALSIDASGYIYARKTGVANLATSSSPLTAGVVSSVGYTRTGTTGTYYINGIAVGTVTDSNDYTVACTQVGSTAGTQFVTGTLRLLGIENRAMSAAEVLAVYQTGTFPASDFGQGVNDSGTTVYAGASMINGANSTFASDSGWWTMTGGTNIAAGVANFVASSTLSRASILTIGKLYRADFTLTASGGTFNVQDGATHFLTGLTTGSQSFEFVSGGTTFGISSVGATGTIDNLTITPLGLFVAPDWAGYTGGPQVIDVSGNGADTNLPGDGVTGGVVPTLPGATPSPFRYTRTSSGYLIADQLTIPPGCSVEIWAKGNGTFSLGDSSGTPASIVNAQTAPTNLSPIAQAGYVTATRKLYLTLGSATSVTVRVTFKSV